MIIGINAGHTLSGQPGCGAVGIIDESVETRNVAYPLMSLFRAGGHTVIDCTDDYAESENADLNKIVSMANAQPLDLFVSIHFNSGGGKGTEVYTYGGTQLAEAAAVCENMNGLGFVNRGVKDGSALAVIHRTAAAAMLIEVCFVDTRSDVDLYRSLGAEKIAQAIYAAITGETVKEGDDLTVTQYEELNRRLSALESEKSPEMIYNYIDDNMPEWAREAVQWSVDNGIVAGDGNGLDLNDVKLWVLVVLYRTAKLIADKAGLEL